MKTVYKTLLTGAMLIGLQASAFAQSNGSSATATGTAKANMVSPITLRPTHDLNFGRFTQPSTGPATLTLDATNVGPLSGQYAPAVSPAVTGGISPVNGQMTDLPNGGEPLQLGTFEATGAPGFTFLITLPTNPVILLNGIAGNPSMSMSAFTSNISSNVATMGAGGFLYFAVGATLNINNNQALGDYTGQFPVTVNYN